MSRTLNVALIGYGFMGRAHSNAYRQVTAFFEPRLRPRLRVLCGRTGERLEPAARQLGFEESATDWRTVIARPDIDLVDICTPGDSHAEIAIAAAAAGKAVLCEKPLANTVAEAEQMVAAVQRAGVPHMVCHNYRRAPAVLLARRLLAEGRIGQVHHFRGTYLSDWIVDPAFPLVWRMYREHAGSGALGDIGSHTLDLARFLVGEVRAVCGALETFVRERPLPDGSGTGTVTVDDAALALLRFENGALGSLEASRFATGRKNQNRLEINGSQGSLVFNAERLNELEVFFSADRADTRGFRTIHVTDAAHPFGGRWWPAGHVIGYEHTFTHTIYELLEALADGRQPEPGFDDGLRTQRVIGAIERASATQRWETVAAVPPAAPPGAPAGPAPGSRL